MSAHVVSIDQTLTVSGYFCYLMDALHGSAHFGPHPPLSVIQEILRKKSCVKIIEVYATDVVFAEYYQAFVCALGTTPTYRHISSCASGYRELILAHHAYNPSNDDVSNETLMQVRRLPRQRLNAARVALRLSPLAEIISLPENLDIVAVAD